MEELEKKENNMGQIIINNRSISGRNISINNNKIIIDGIDVTPDSKTITIKVEGNIESINADVVDIIEVNGSVDDIKTMSGNVSVSGNISGNVKTMSGNVSCGNIDGNVKTMSGNIKHK